MSRKNAQSSPTRATLRDVARAAGVSPITVSRALRAPDLLLPETKARIDAAIAECHYVPDLAARGFRINRTDLVAAVVPSIDTIYGEMLQGINDTISAHGVQLMVGVSGLSLEHEERVLRAFLGRRPDAIVLTGGDHTDAARQMLKRARVPIVETGALLDQPLDMNIGFSEERAAGAMVDFLVAAGHRHIGFLCGPIENNERARRRLEGFRTAIEGHRLTSESAVVFTRGVNFADGADALRRLVAAHPLVRCVFCSSDVFAIGALLECQRNHWAVPGEIAIAGFLGMPLTTEVVPTLTTVSVPRYEIGQQAGRMIIRRLTNQLPDKTRVDLGFRIVPGGST